MRFKKWVVRLTLSLAFGLAVIVVLQQFYAHRKDYFVPDYPKEKLTEESDYELIFRQTGLGKSATDKLISAGAFESILDIQQAYFHKPQVECISLLGMFTMEDRLKEKRNIPFVDLQPGDIILTLSTHSVGWRHGHAGLILDENSVLECVTLGKKSTVVDVKHWKKYSNIAQLRVKGSDSNLGQKVATFAKENLCGIPYHLTAGLIGEKAPDIDEPYFGMQCDYLVWYAWKYFGYDLDSDGGRLVTSYDLLNSDLLEIVQMYGMEMR